MPPGSALSVTSIFIIESVRPDAAGKRPPAGVSSPPSTASATVTPLILAVKQESERWRDYGTLVLSTRGEMQISVGLSTRNLTIPEPDARLVDVV